MNIKIKKLIQGMQELYNYCCGEVDSNLTTILIQHNLYNLHKDLEKARSTGNFSEMTTLIKTFQETQQKLSCESASKSEKIIAMKLSEIYAECDAHDTDPEIITIVDDPTLAALRIDNTALQHHTSQLEKKLQDALTEVNRQVQEIRVLNYRLMVQDTAIRSGTKPLIEKITTLKKELLNTRDSYEKKLTETRAVYERQLAEYRKKEQDWTKRYRTFQSSRNIFPSSQGVEMVPTSTAMSQHQCQNVKSEKLARPN